jgi:hypothetical protein
VRLPILVTSLLIVSPSGGAGAADTPAETRPAAGLTNSDAITTFGGAVMDCLQAVMDGRTVDTLGRGAAVQVQPATPADRRLAPPQTPASTPVWVTSKLGYLMNITEPSSERCEVHAIQLPVDRTLQAVVVALSKAAPDLKPVHVEPGYNPFAYQLEAVSHGARYVVHLEGAEPGTPGHTLRFSLLYAWVQKE